MTHSNETDEYTPTTDEIRDEHRRGIEGGHTYPYRNNVRRDAGAEFDRWLLAERAEWVAEGAEAQRNFDAQLAKSFDWQSWSEPNKVLAAVIREGDQT